MWGLGGVVDLLGEDEVVGLECLKCMKVCNTWGEYNIRFTFAENSEDVHILVSKWENVPGNVQGSEFIVKHSAEVLYRLWAP